MISVPEWTAMVRLCAFSAPGDGKNRLIEGPFDILAQRFLIVLDRGDVIPAVFASCGHGF